MSSRALRKAQREAEEKAALERLKAEAAELEHEDESEQEEAVIKPQKSAFAMLEDAEEDEDADEAEMQPETEESDVDSEPTTSPTPTASKPTAKASKKKKKKKKAKAPPSQQPAPAKDKIDEIDRALQELSTSNGKVAAASELSATEISTKQTCSLLAIEQPHLLPANEMRKLFGRSAIEEQPEAPARAPRGGRRHRNQADMVGIGAAVNQENTVGGRGGLSALALKRNIFVQGKESWPRGSAGGLTMEVVQNNEDGTVEYAFVHNKTYQDVDLKFEQCVRAMDPEPMIFLLRQEPYHISTLLQVSEIAKQERDHATAGDLLERALFTFGRAVHSSFSKALSEGRARMDFLRAENREFWLAVWRYMTNLVMRGTHRTVYEWAKLLLSLSPKEDPYGLHLVIDQYAIRARQYTHFLSLYEYSFSDVSEIKLAPNMVFSAGLAALQQSTKDTDRAHEILRSAVDDFPWLAVSLLDELGVDETPPSIWGRRPGTDYEKLIATLYATRAKDLWSNPEATAFLLDVCKTAKPPKQSEDLGVEIDINIARHVILSDTPAFIALLPRIFTQNVGSASDPLPPGDVVPGSNRQGVRSMLSNMSEIPPQFISVLRNWFSSGEAPPEVMDELQRAVLEGGVEYEEGGRHPGMDDEEFLRLEQEWASERERSGRGPTVEDAPDDEDDAQPGHHS